MKKIFTFLLLSWFAFKPITNLSGQCNPATTVVAQCLTNPFALVDITILDSIPLGNNIHFEWSNGNEQWENVTNPVFPYVASTSVPVLAPGYYSITVTTDGGCVFVEDSIYIDCDDTGSTCGHFPAYSYECVIFSNSIETTVTAVIWDVAGAPAQPYSFVWSTGDTTYASMQNGIYMTQLIGTDLNGTVSVTVTDSDGCSWVDSFVVDCATVPACPPSSSIAFECVNDTADVDLVIWEPTFADSLLSFVWNSPNPTSTAIENGYVVATLENVTDGHYAVTVSTSGGCSWVESIDVDCTPGTDSCGHLMSFVYECVVFTNETVVTATVVVWDVASAPSQPFQFIWSSGDTSYASMQNGIYISQLTSSNLTGNNSVTITDSDGCVEIEDNWTINCMWPGDTDLNGGVNHYDLLNIGLGYSTTGETRDAATLIWMPQEAPYWNKATPVTTVNYVYSDTDGDGEVTDTDQQAILFNWSETVATGQSIDNTRDLPQIGSVAIPFFVEGDEVVEGQVYSFPVVLGTPEIPVEGIYGLAFSVFYDPAVIDAELIYASFGGSWIGTLGNDMIAVQKNFPDENRLDIAITRTDGQAIDGYGAICQLEIIVIEDVIFMNGLDKELIENAFQITDVLLIDHLEKELAAAPMSTSIEVFDQVSGTNAINPLIELTVRPNPVTNECTVRSSVVMEMLSLYTPSGQKVLSREVAAKQVALPLNHLPPGIYLLHIQTAQGVAVEKLHLLSSR